MLRSTLSNWREYLTPISHTSTFETSGQLTPEEFVKAGDYLVHMFPTWKWNGTDFQNVHHKDFLPSDKQFLVTKKVPCKLRANTFLELDDTETKDVGDGWALEEEQETGKEGASSKVADALEELHIVDDVDEDDDEEYDNELYENELADNDIVDIKPTTLRYYDLYITYSTSYRVPKMYLCGYDNDGTPLSPDQMFEDIAADYRSKTATIEPLPFFKGHNVSVSIHPCKHANVMKVLMEKVRSSRSRARSTVPQAADEDWEDLQSDVEDGLRVDQYLVVFLKFITSVTPGIEHDYTMEGW
ncbi:unnamed protein product [Kluyveromyces dobzhanskii CBS 2104]|uniref:Autophagy-related protein 3 n=1 Tax=Kluyveromyces dobzhanskii CBS 2104 TaxID=1427455 RepID=A0A0A8LBS1_9SACH|nr:unnamed protein product [Kluyveromyces dobzhanskii CBS 2104]